MSSDWARGGTARGPMPPPKLRNREGTGIGFFARNEPDPTKRTTKMKQEVPEFVNAPREDFPLLFQVKDPASKTLKEFGKSARAEIEEHLREAGAMLFRGLPIKSAEDFSQFMVGTNLPAVRTHGVSQRNCLAPLVYGASDDVPPTHTLHPHNEQAYLAPDGDPTYPRKLFFCCITPPKPGTGETPIVSNREVTRKLKQEVRDRFKDTGGVRYQQVLPSGEMDPELTLNLGGEQSWQCRFQTTDKDECEKKCKAKGYTPTWDEKTDALTIEWTRPAFITDEDGKDLWWNQASNVFSFTKVMYGDGTVVEDEVQEHFNAVYWQCAVAFTWEQGDVLAVDNTRAYHARMSFDPPRKIVCGFSAI